MMCSCLTVFSWNWESEIYGRKTQFCSWFHLHLKRVCHHNIFFSFYIFFGPHFRIIEFFFLFYIGQTLFDRMIRSLTTAVIDDAIFSFCSILWNVLCASLAFNFLPQCSPSYRSIEMCLILMQETWVFFSFFLLSCHLGLMLDMGHIKGNWKLVHTYDECGSAKKWPWHSASGVDCVVAGI